ncbi:MAG: hypothetical protein NTX17_07835 [Candidatus Eisenbacteria bacterium]|nr:hypothetical protein [Candidatus Eisenbacteria bacterium]
MAENSGSSKSDSEGKGAGDTPAQTPSTAPNPAVPVPMQPAPGPNPNVVAPNMELVTHGADDSKVTRVIIGPRERSDGRTSTGDKGEAKE